MLVAADLPEPKKIMNAKTGNPGMKYPSRMRHWLYVYCSRKEI